MDLPLFDPLNDPGPSFIGLLKARDLLSPAPFGALDSQVGQTDRIGQGQELGQGLSAHGTTVVALRHAEGVLLAGDRRATSGNFIRHRNIEKVFPAGHHSGVAVAGAAGPSIEMVRLFQLQIEHYEKVEGQPLSLEGQANQLGQLVRSNLAAALTGLAAIPLFAGYDPAEKRGRLFKYDLTGGRYEEQDYAAGGSGSLHAGTVIKLRFKHDLSTLEATEVAMAALFEAADEDSATGGPDLMRRIFPVIASITSDGYRRIPDEEIEEHFRTYLSQQTEQAAQTEQTEQAAGSARSEQP